MARLRRLAGMHPLRVTAALSVATLPLIAGACGAAGQDRLADTTSDEIVVPRLGWADADGRQVALPDTHFLQGRLPAITPGEPVLVNFWASTCAPCRKEMPLLQGLADDGVTVIGVTRDRFDTFALRALHRAGATYPTTQDADAAYMQAFSGLVPLGLIPSSVVVVDGKVTRVHIGPFHTTKDLDEVRALAHS